MLSEDILKSISNSLEILKKGRRADPPGTIKNGRIKLADGTWRPVSQKKKKQKPGEGGGQTMPTGRKTKDNPFDGRPKASLKREKEKIAKLIERFKDDPEKMAKLKQMSSQVAQALKNFGKKKDK